MLRPEELDALGLTLDEFEARLHDADHVPGTIFAGSQSAALWMDDFGVPLRECTGLEMKRGSLNVCAHHPVRIPAPVELPATGGHRGEPAYFSPVVVDGAVLGFAMRDDPRPKKNFVELFAHTWVRDRLGLEVGDSVRLSLLPGEGLLG